jgi:uncharacterized protein YyaL (SSP411 family)
MKNKKTFLAVLILFLCSCTIKDTKSQQKDKKQNAAKTHNTTGHMGSPDSTHAHTNQLIDETSPYLLQHAHNPVDWYPWGDAAFEKAKKENKLVLVSIGYSACHWCHVMEHESFENEAVADIMNDHFVCIKVDREERPDVDQIYMSAVHLMGQRGGWPLNVFTLPDGRPIYGGTYFQKSQWTELLGKLDVAFREDSARMYEYATQLTQGVKMSELVPMETEERLFKEEDIKKIVTEWATHFDNTEGGPDRSPKFPLPNNYVYLLRYAHLTGNEDIMKHVKLTLDKMAYGGIYDQIGGGFARYSTDAKWKAPHFEKMLYDNAQLMSLYSEAYQATKDETYKDIVYESLEFIARELTSEEGAFYSALDADSEGEEGKFYVWKKEELKALLSDDEYDLAKDYYNINSVGLWEHGNYILLRKKTDEEIITAHKLSDKKLDKMLSSIKSKLMKERDTRIRPGLDDKTLTSWNGLMIKGYIDAYQAFDEQRFLDAALKNAEFILSKQQREDGGLNHSYKEGRSTINGYLEDYCFTIQAFTALYEATFDEKWLNEANKLALYTMDHFYDEKSGMFYFTSDIDPPLIARKMESTDNVIPASNSSMGNALYVLSHYFDNEKYRNVSKQMLNNMYKQMSQGGSWYSNWMLLALNHIYPFYEIAITGDDLHDFRKELNTHYIPNKMLLGTTVESKLPLLELKLMEGETTIFVCENKVCQLPVNKVKDALKQIK